MEFAVINQLMSNNLCIGGSMVSCEATVRTLKMMGLDAEIVIVGKKSGRKVFKGRDSFEYIVMTPDELLAHPCKKIIHMNYAGGDYLWKLMEQGAVVRHGELKRLRKDIRLEQAAHRWPDRQIILRESMRVALPQATLIPHIYERKGPPEKLPTKHAVCFARIAGEKKIAMICEANRLLKPDHRVEFIAALDDRIFIHHVLDKKYPEWREQYRGTFAEYGGGYDIACQYSICLNLTTFKEEGGSTENVSLEVWDAERMLVTHTDWVKFDPSWSRFSYQVSNAVELAVLLDRDGYVPHDIPDMSQFSPEVVGKIWLDFIERMW